jgi:hypothetical protein
LERNKKFLTSILDNGDSAFIKLFEGLISNGQPFLGELLESEGNIYICLQSLLTKITTTVSLLCIGNLFSFI